MNTVSMEVSPKGKVRAIVSHEGAEIGRTGWCNTHWSAARKAEAIAAEHTRRRLRPDWYEPGRDT